MYTKNLLRKIAMYIFNLHYARKECICLYFYLSNLESPNLFFPRSWVIWNYCIYLPEWFKIQPKILHYESYPIMENIYIYTSFLLVNYSVSNYKVSLLYIKQYLLFLLVINLWLVIQLAIIWLFCIFTLRGTNKKIFL